VKRLTASGGRAFIESPKSELVSILLTATLSDQFYRSGDATAARVKELVAGSDDKAFVAKAAIYARGHAQSSRPHQTSLLRPFTIAGR
jgi:hypothetical protein